MTWLMANSLQQKEESSRLQSRLTPSLSPPWKKRGSENVFNKASARPQRPQRGYILNISWAWVWNHFFPAVVFIKSQWGGGEMECVWVTQEQIIHLWLTQTIKELKAHIHRLLKSYWCIRTQLLIPLLWNSNVFHFSLCTFHNLKVLISSFSLCHLS